MNNSRIDRKNFNELGKSVANLPPERHANFLKVYGDTPHFMMGFSAELRRLKEEGEEYAWEMTHTVGTGVGL
jgi:hypothetical protein